MKKVFFLFGLFILMISLSSCSSEETAEKNIHSEIHNKYYHISSYNAECVVTAFTPGGENSYECSITYNSDDSSYEMTSGNMKIQLSKDKTIISKGETLIESLPSEADMYIFVNTFFKSYYEAEDTSVTTGAGDDETTLLECSVINPTVVSSSMKLWVDNKTVLPLKMQIFGKDEKINTEIIFKEFRFI